MQIKLKLIVLFNFFTTIVLANINSTISEGSKNASPLCSKGICILEENITVHISSNFNTAKYTIEYIIKTENDDIQIPLLFLSKDISDEFTVWADGKKIETKEIPNYIFKPTEDQFHQFNQYFYHTNDSNTYINIHWGDFENKLYHLADFTYFKTNFKKGIHKINVAYTANSWTNYTKWIKEYSFRYSIEPIKYSTSLKKWSLLIIQDGNQKNITTNLGNPIEGEIGKSATWKLNTISTDIIKISYTPPIHTLIKILIILDPLGIMLIAGILLATIHIILIVKFRKKYPTIWFNWIMLLGSFLVPYFMYFCFFYSYILIDHLLGAEASNNHGFSFLLVLWLPYLMLIYFVLVLLIDILIKRKMKLKSN